MKKYEWSRLNHLQLGRYSEYLAMMEFTLYGFDVYSAEVDDKGIDFLIRKSSSEYFEVQVKSSRNLNYIFLVKTKFKPQKGLLAIVVLFKDYETPDIYLIPSLEWIDNPSRLLVEHNYEGKKSKPEWGINLSQTNLKILKQYKFEEMVNAL